MLDKTQDTILLTTGEPYDWSETPEPFRQILDKKSASRLVKISADALVRLESFDATVKAQKGALLDLIAGMVEDDERIAATFDGTTLVVIGVCNERASG